MVPTLTTILSWTTTLGMGCFPDFKNICDCLNKQDP